jgi:hypothetical protein
MSSISILNASVLVPLISPSICLLSIPLASEAGRCGDSIMAMGSIAGERLILLCLVSDALCASNNSLLAPVAAEIAECGRCEAILRGILT